MCEIEHNLFIMGIISTFFSYLLILVGFISKNKYSVLSSSRTVVILLNLELLLNFFIVCLTLISESLSFTQIVSLQSNFK
jgi:NADH:ubiquinone oxidoreductase subunit H